MLPEMKNEKIYRELLSMLGYTPFQHQLLAYEAIAGGYNVILSAPTGSGKTEAALLPILATLVNSKRYNPVSVLYITPLKALTNDLVYRIRKFFEPFGLTVARKHGDVPVKERKERIRHAPIILITTPESLEVDLDISLKFWDYLRNVRWVIIDELHEISHNKRGLQLAILLERLRRLAGDFQVIGLSATVLKPLSVFKPFLGSSSRRLKAITAKGKRYLIKVLKSADLVESLKDLVSDGRKTLVFVDSRRLAEKLFEGLSNMKTSKVAVHHSSIAGGIKERVEASFRRGDVQIVITTKTLELGIDVGDISRVIHIGAPSTVYSLLQRAGRAGHRLSEVSEAVILVDKDDDYYLSIAAEKLVKEGIMEKMPSMPCYLDVVSREILGHSLRRRTSLKEILSILTSVQPCRERLGDLSRLIELLESNGLLKKDGKGFVRVGGFFYKVWSKDGAGVDIKRFFSTIQSSDDKFVVRWENKDVGFLDTTYVLKYLRPWDRIRIGGRVWEVTNIDLIHKSINVHPATSSGFIPLWIGSLIDHSALLTDRFFKCLRKCEDCNICESDVVKWFKELNIEPPKASELLLEQVNDLYVLYGAMGHRFFELLGYILAYLGLTTGKGIINVKVSPYGLAAEEIPGLFKTIRALGLKGNRLVREAIKITPHYHVKLRELLPSFGSLKSSLVREEAVKQVLEYFNSESNNAKLIDELLSGKIKVRVVNALTPSPIAEMISKAPNLRPWYGGSQYVIVESLRGMALTAEEIAEVSGLPVTYVERKLKRMRSLPGRVKVIAIYDPFDGRIRWVLKDDLERLALTDLKESFTPRYGGTYVISLLTDTLDPGRSIVLRVGRDRIDNIGEGIYVDVFYKVVVRPLTRGRALTYYYVPKEYLSLIIMNAVTYLERMGYADIV